ncbi:hypothetical protein CPB86DRAFT_710796 [Serendipita vermifera]|nr:hypothetical protein CPB86DRAFT_710796 [Serendipita vermifera]
MEKETRDIESAIESYLQDDVQLPHWEPQRGTPEMRSHIESLKLPASSSSSSSFPSLLLHNLGELSHDRLLPERIKGIFSTEIELRFLCNTSGSGKTRLLLEGLCDNWGFYFTARRDPDKIGSSDVETSIEYLGIKLTPLKGENWEASLAKNRETAHQSSLLLLYVRMVIFRIFLQCAKKLDGEIKRKHKKSWLLIQIAPWRLMDRTDIFRETLFALGRPSLEDLNHQVHNEHKLVRKLIKKEPIFFVLDEAQGLTHKYEDCFRSYHDETQPRPILRQIIKAWLESDEVLIISGTGILMKKMEITLGSAWGKHDEEFPAWTDVGAFDTEESQQSYLLQYIPPNLLDPLLTDRLEYWLCGRRIPNYLQILLKNGFESPHLLLNEYILAMTNGEVAEEGLPDETPLDPKLKAEIKNNAYGKEADFANLLKRFEEEPSLKSTLTSFFYELYITGKVRSCGGRDGDLLVELGISRFKKSGVENYRESEITEHLMIFGLLDLFKNSKLTMEGHLIQELGSAHPSARGLSFEPFGAFLLGRAFSSPRPLSDVFEFAEDSIIKDEPAELVALERVDSSFKYTRIDIDSPMPPYPLGCSPSTLDGTLKWLNDPKGIAFCFPPNTVGPDLIMILRLTQHGVVLRVCVQIKNTEDLKGINRTRAIRTIEPDHWFSQYKNHNWTVSNPSMRDRMAEALKNLGSGTDAAGTYGVLRVILAHPPITDLIELKEAARGSHRHPVAIVSVSKLASKGSKAGQMLDELADGIARGPNKKRKRESGSTKTAEEYVSRTKEVTDESPPKKRKGKTIK